MTHNRAKGRLVAAPGSSTVASWPQHCSSPMPSPRPACRAIRENHARMRWFVRETAHVRELIDDGEEHALDRRCRVRPRLRRGHLADLPALVDRWPVAGRRLGGGGALPSSGRQRREALLRLCSALPSRLDRLELRAVAYARR